MGLISRVSSRTYRDKSNLVKMLFRRASALATRLTRGRNIHNIPKEKIDGDYQVWVGYLRKPPPAVTGFDIPNWAPYAGWAAIGIFMWVWASGPVLRNRELRREVVGKYISPQLEISQCKTEQERRDFVQAFIDAHYKDDDEEEDDE